MHPVASCIVAAVAFVVVTPAVAADRNTAPKAQFLNSAQAQKGNFPFSEAVRAGDFLLLSGQVGMDRATGKVVGGGIEAEARQTLRNIQEVLERNGSSLGAVVKCTVFLADMAEWGKFNTVYREFFKSPFPARSALGVNGLALGARVEVECMAYEPAQKGG